jgi:hypothetical protein
VGPTRPPRAVRVRTLERDAHKVTSTTLEPPLRDRRPQHIAQQRLATGQMKRASTRGRVHARGHASTLGEGGYSSAPGNANTGPASGVGGQRYDKRLSLPCAMTSGLRVEAYARGR